MGFSPLVGLHTFLGLALACIFQLNKGAVLVGVWTNNPWFAVPFYTCATWLGIYLMGFPEGVSLPDVGFFDLFRPEFWGWLMDQWKLLIPAVLGSFVLCTLLAALSYLPALYVIKKYRRRHLDHLSSEMKR